MTEKGSIQTLYPYKRREEVPADSRFTDEEIQEIAEELHVDFGPFEFKASTFDVIPKPGDVYLLGYPKVCGGIH